MKRVPAQTEDTMDMAAVTHSAISKLVDRHIATVLYDFSAVRPENKFDEFSDQPCRFTHGDQI